MCEAGATSHCEQYDCICNDGPRPERWSEPDAATLPRIDFLPVPDSDDEPAAHHRSPIDASCSTVVIRSAADSALASRLAIMLAIAALWLRHSARRATIA